MTDWRSETAQRLRGLIMGAEPDMVEEVKVTFAKGASLPDPHSVFNASLTAGTRRAVDVREDVELDADAFGELVSAAVALNRS